MSLLRLGDEVAGPEVRPGRPRLTFFRPDRQDLPPFVRGHLDDHVRCLGEFFDVTLVEDDCDYDEVCDRTRPDLTLFESGVYVRQDRRITRTASHPEIPKIGLLDADAYCLTRSVFLSDMDAWGVGTFFTISLSLPSRAPELDGRLYVWPNFADARVFRSYAGDRSTPLLLTGSNAPNYPWRTRVNRLIRDRFAVDVMAHGGWFDAATTATMVHGEPYARALSAALIVPTCGTIAHELVRKHLEVPAAGALLLTERTAAVEAAGFVDMETCVFADETDVVDKVEHLLEHPEEIARISGAGQELAHSRHDLTHRSQLLQWYRLSRKAGPGEVVAQPDVFADLVLRPRPALPASPPARPAVGLDAALLADADAASAARRLEEARSAYLRVLNVHYEPEAALGLARTCLRAGDASRAEEWVGSSIVRTLSWHGAASPDPVEWSVHVLALVGQGRLDDAVAAARMFDRLDHEQLARVRHVVERLAGSASATSPERARLSIHREPRTTWGEWVEDVVQMLDACGQPGLARRTAALAADEEPRAVAAPEPGGRDESPAASGPRAVGSRPVEPRRSLLVRARGRLSRALARPAGAPGENPLSGLLAGRGLTLYVTVGLVPGDPAVDWVAREVRRSAEPCTLVSIGDPSPVDAPVEEIIGAGGNPAVDVSHGLPIELDARSVVVIGGRAVARLGAETVRGAGVVVVAGRGSAVSPLAVGLDADSTRRRVAVPAPASGAEITAWELGR